ncbi:homoserine kinase [Cupriavidus taiwanensis]|uniref:Homoserine kinase n=1 Tax=Cupriavidus taiwanensis TaxID=164546 RepID=A0A7Z7NLQ7_9BURK|nr:homoserine kinase [Cupriavidus taiwanensis]SOY88602.1 HOMOSERINE KINASE PROTEIN [Cupriavidus taiwanensis]SOZ06100.1 HOMOSERINE KINASE PROTEIN [Cupriavidus taiwanensis]SOZ08084.1 HOMOSERINE KINASE PROTEIN [Cupriavidus taiwanensis]SPC18630.1 HOMOSERINE KINASE PROTEIN [Cupriavidus taiwanensis]SPD40870.1 Homoserine kinase [Cupriavidus taiwanensis]
MAVFTTVSQDEIARWLLDFDLGEVRELRGIASGIENSNFFLTMEHEGQTRQYVLTIFERLSFTQLPYYLHLMAHLAERGIRVPAPIPARDGEILRALKGKPATIVTRLPGASQLAPDAQHCAEVGDMLARMHLAGADYPRRQPNLRSLPWWQQTEREILPFLDAGQRALLQREIAHQAAFFASAAYASLGEGPCHCDLFRDNALFEEDASGRHRLGGFFDFYFAGNDKWLFDVAVTVNDWCIDLATGELDAERAQALLRAYHAVRPLTGTEAAHWQDMLRAGALRFWVSRLWDFYLPREADMLQPHDPTHFERILRRRLDAQPANPESAPLPWI